MSKSPKGSGQESAPFPEDKEVFWEAPAQSREAQKLVAPLGGALLLGYFLLDEQEKVTRPAVLYRMYEFRGSVGARSDSGTAS